jgi:predicted acylesterase/phospholipase RssA
LIKGQEADMQPFRKNVAVAIDGGGIRGVMITQALIALEKELGQPVGEIFMLAAGTSTGSIISAGLGAGLSAQRMYELYMQLGTTIFPNSLRSRLWPIFPCRYSGQPLVDALKSLIGEIKMGDYWTATPRKDIVIVLRDLVENRTRFVKPWKDEYRDWPVWKAVLASSSVPTYFPVVEGRYVDGGVGSYSNPCYAAAFEAVYCLGWDPKETTLISVGSGRTPDALTPHQADRFISIQWLTPLVDTFLDAANDQQVHIVKQFFPDLDLRRFQINIPLIEMDDVSRMNDLTEYGKKLGQMIVNDQMDVEPERPMSLPS